MKYAKILLSTLGLGLLLSACGSNYTPKPRGYFRIEFPEKKYQTYRENAPYSFDYPVYAQVQTDTRPDAQPYWIDLAFPQFNGRLHLSYLPINSTKKLNQLTEDARTFAFKHTVKATAIDEGIIYYPEKKVYGIYYTIEGNTASSAQFYLTDSSKNYLRGALYFNEQPRIDSIKPVLNFIKKDIDVFIKTFKWRK
ncbi:MAG: gliding motility lipoprotein GldD [Sphingobacteriaceae bacterium]